MYINRIVLRDVRNFKHLDITLRNEWTQQPLKSVLFTGPNGSGKTTLMRILALLWDHLGFSINPFGEQQYHAPYLLNDAGLAAIELSDYPLPLTNNANASSMSSIWIYAIRGQTYLADLRALVGDVGRIIAPEFFGAKFQTPLSNADEWKKLLYSWRQKLQVGAENTEPLPNAVFFEAENRQIIPPEGNPDTYAEPLYKWHVSYEPRRDQEGHIESMLRNLKVRSPELFQRTIEQINTFFVGKKLLDFDDSLRLTVQLSSGKTHHIEDLSAGERQCLILVFMVSRWLMPGGIVLIDEPDLHLHVSLQRQLVHEIERIVAAKGGQLIVTSHSPTVWEEYNELQRIELGEAAQHD